MRRNVLLRRARERERCIAPQEARRCRGARDVGKGSPAALLVALLVALLALVVGIAPAVQGAQA